MTLFCQLPVNRLVQMRESFIKVIVVKRIENSMMVLIFLKSTFSFNASGSRFSFVPFIGQVFPRQVFIEAEHIFKGLNFTTVHIGPCKTKVPERGVRNA